MTEEVKICHVNASFVRLVANKGVLMELSEHFTFDIPGAKFMKTHINRGGWWDGRIRLLNLKNGFIYYGLVEEIIKFCLKKKYKPILDKELIPTQVFTSLDHIKKWINTLAINDEFEQRDYQLIAAMKAINDKRVLLLSPTASGKSFIIFLISQFMKATGKKLLITVPTTSLVLQMESDLRSYTPDDLSITTIMSGREKVTNSDIVISTWQSIFRLPKEWFDSFECIIGDEAHLYQANSLKTLMEKCANCYYRIGTTGTLDGTLTNKMVLEGLFGRVFKVISTSQLISQGYASPLKIECLVLEYSEEDRKLMKKAEYQQEKAWLMERANRNNFIVNLATKLDGNSVVLFDTIDHGKKLFAMIKEKTNRPVFYIAGEVEAEVREEIRSIIAKLNDAIIVASAGTFSTGINAPTLKNIIFAIGNKSRVKTLQSIGRVLRKQKEKLFATLYDITDDMCIKSHQNYSFRHWLERIKFYDSEEFEYTIRKIGV